MVSSAISRLTNLHRHLLPADSKLLESDDVSGLMKISPEVAEALSSGQPVVALESTVISHGMPYPQNLETAKQLEAIVRVNGAIPATIAILDGVPCIGLSMEDLQKLANLGTRAQKTARRDIAHVVSTRGNGATTVSATMFFASKVGIPIFVTGGIGGVHRHGENTLDVSSDLTELGRTPVAVVSAGVKSILDIPRTLEYLETQGVCVATYATNDFPAFFTERSGCQEEKVFSCLDGFDRSFSSSNNKFCVEDRVPCRVDTPEDCARLIDANVKLRLGTGILFAVPIPKEYSASGRLIEDAIQRAIGEARTKNITGNAETPFLLSRVNELTGGASLASNIALLKNNARVGAKIAAALAQLRGHQNGVQHGLWRTEGVRLIRLPELIRYIFLLSTG
ncbi:pseudouridine-5'-phosphate glycosidase [Rhodamnia argentea]|uniref:Pseudouridine-5'-phosphate glycosidase n=1 Tax=Rhodamnia argentea TaxID=178133 RepID=A0ABM3HT14_9MYRT|nr:pseudouridine-5'-phosphate glycosidase [Rhodamnia argentea]